MKKSKTIKSVALILLAAFNLLALSSCVPLALGAAGGYMLNEKGYKVRSPIKKSSSND